MKRERENDSLINFINLFGIKITFYTVVKRNYLTCSNELSILGKQLNKLLFYFLQIEKPED